MKISLIFMRCRDADLRMMFALLLLSSNRDVEGYAKLGSPKPNECRAQKYDCPSHMMCVPRDDGSSHCICDRFIGYRGPDCRQQTRATWLLSALCIIIMLWGFRALISNITLALELKETGRLKANSIGRTLFFNTLASLGPIVLAAGFLVTIFEIDPNTKWYQHGFASIAVSYFFFFLSTLSVSVVWIIDVQKTAAMDMGIEAARHKKRQERVFLTSAYAISLSAAALVVVIYFFSERSIIEFISIVGILYSAIVGASYHFAGRRVIRDLVSASLSTLRQKDIAQIAQNIQTTSQIMTRLMLGNSVGFIGIALTAPSGTPTYAAQNTLPRVLQAQIFYFITQACFLGVNQLIVEYMRYGSSRRHLKPQSVLVSVVRRLLCIPSTKRGADRQVGRVRGRRGSSSRDSASHRRSDELSSWNPGGQSFSSSDAQGHVISKVDGSQVFYFNLNGQDALNRRVVKVATDGALHEPQLYSSEGAHPLVPIVLGILFSDEEICRVRGKTVMDIGGGVLVDLISDDLKSIELEGLSEGSHAFVRCFGERHLRCSWHTFDFGFAGGHPLLANSDRVLMAGEMEVDAQGVVTRWLLKSGSNVPPSWVVRQSGLPLSTAWVFVTMDEVRKFTPNRKAALLKAGSLIDLESIIGSRRLEAAPSLTTRGDVSVATVTTSISSSSESFDSICNAFRTTIDTSDDGSNNVDNTAIGTINDAPDVASNDSVSGVGVATITGNSGTSVIVDVANVDFGGIQECVVPDPSRHAKKMSIMKIDEKMWRTSLARLVYVAAREIVALFQTLKCRIKLIIKCNRFWQNRVHPVGWDSSRGSSLRGDIEDFGLDNVGQDWILFDEKVDTPAPSGPISPKLPFGTVRKHSKSSVPPKWPTIEESIAEDDDS